MRLLFVSLLPACTAAASAGGGAPGHTPAPVCAGPSGPGVEIPLERPDHPSRVDGIDGLPVWLGGDDLLAMVHAGDDRTIYAVVDAPGCGVETPCRPEVIRVVDNLVTDRVAIPGSETIAPAPSPFELEWAALEDHDGDGTKELWLGYAISSVQHGSAWRMRFYAILGGAPLAGKFFAEHTALPTHAEGWECHHTGLFAVDTDCDQVPELVMSQNCQMLQCLGDAPDRPAVCDPGVVFTSVSRRQPDGTYRADVRSEPR